MAITHLCNFVFCLRMIKMHCTGSALLQKFDLKGRLCNIELEIWNLKFEIWKAAFAILNLVKLQQGCYVPTWLAECFILQPTFQSWWRWTSYWSWFWLGHIGDGDSGDYDDYGASLSWSQWFLVEYFNTSHSITLSKSDKRGSRRLLGSAAWPQRDFVLSGLWSLRPQNSRWQKKVTNPRTESQLSLYV